jgi:hypothetical protein
LLKIKIASLNISANFFVSGIFHKMLIFVVLLFGENLSATHFFFIRYSTRPVMNEHYTPPLSPSTGLCRCYIGSFQPEAVALVMVGSSVDYG